MLKQIGGDNFLENNKQINICKLIQICKQTSTPPVFVSGEPSETKLNPNLERYSTDQMANVFLIQQILFITFYSNG